MRRWVVILVAMCLGTAALADDPKPEPLSAEAKQELAKLQGEWVVKAMGRLGQKFVVLEEKLILEIKDAKWIFTAKEKGLFIAIDPKADPKRFDLKSIEEGRKGQVDLAIYKIDGDTLTICLDQGNQKHRPTAFETSQDKPDTILMVFERVKKK